MPILQTIREQLISILFDKIRGNVTNLVDVLYCVNTTANIYCREEWAPKEKNVLIIVKGLIICIKAQYNFEKY